MADIVTLDQVRAFLKFNDSYTDDDDFISNTLVPAATGVIRRYCGDVIPRQYEEWLDGGDYSVWTRHTPLLRVILCEEGWGWTNYSLEEVQVNSATASTMFAFSIDMPNSGKISRRSGGSVNIPFVRGVSNIHLIYETGYADIPQELVLAGLALIEVWYRAWMQDQAEADPYSGLEGEYQFGRSGDTTTARWFGVPDYIVAMLGAHPRDPIIG